MALLDPPKQFVRQLLNYDPYLRLRWSDSERRWRIERKITHSRPTDPKLYEAQAYEDYVAACDGYIAVLFCEREQLDNRVFYSLWYNDIQRRGGGQRVAREMDTAEENARLRSRACWLDEVYGKAKETYRYMNTVRVVPENDRHSAPRGGMSIMGEGY